MAKPVPMNPIEPRIEPEQATLRDRFAMRALPFCCLAARDKHPKGGTEMLATYASKRAYVIADAMLAAREPKS